MAWAEMLPVSGRISFCCHVVIAAMYAGTLTAVLAAPSMEPPIDSMFDLLEASREGRAVPVMLFGSAVMSAFQVRK